MAGVAPANPKTQFSSTTGVPLVNGTLTVYLAGTTTLTNTWQDSALTVLNTNPITLDARGEALVWLDSSKTYKFLLKDAAGATAWTVDNIKGAIGGADLSGSGGSASVGFIQSGTGAVARTVENKLRDVIDVFDFLSADERADVVARTGLYTITTKMQAALDAVPTGGTLKLHSGLYLGHLLARRGNFSIVGDGSASTEIKVPAGTTHTITQDGGPGTVTGVPCVIDVGHIGNGNFATAYENVHLEGLTLNGNKANTTAPTLDLFGWGLSFTKITRATYHDIVAKDCHCGGVGTFINSNHHIGEAIVENSGTALGHPGFDVNSSKYSIWNAVSRNCRYGARMLDNCFGNQFTVAVYNATLTGVVYNNQTANASHGNIINATVIDGCTGQGMSVGTNCTGSQINLTVKGVTGIGFYDYIADDAYKPRGNTYNVNTYRCGEQGSYVGGYLNVYNILSRFDGLTGAAGSVFAVDVNGKYNTLYVSVEDSATPQVRGLVIRASCPGNNIAKYNFNTTVQNFLLSDTSNTTIYPTRYERGGAYTWEAASLAAGWSNTFGSPYPAVQYLLDNNGYVHVKGTVNGGAGTIFTLPAGYRPATDTLLFPTIANGATGRLEVTSAGVVTLATGTATSVDLSPIYFPIY